MKKILIITTHWLYDYGGRRIASTKIINDLSQKGFDITVIDFEAGQRSIPQIKAKKNINFDSKVHFLSYFVKSNASLIPKLINISKTNQFDIVICSSGPYCDVLSILTIKIFKLFRNAKIVLFSHTHPLRPIQFFTYSIQYFIFHLGYFVLSYFVYGFFDKIVTPGSALKDFFVYHLRISKEKISVINYPIYNKLINRKKIAKGGNKKTLITAARLDLSQKDFLTLLRTLKELNTKIECQLIILGEGEDREKIVRFAKNIGVSDQITLLGFKKNPIDYIKKADIFVLSTFYEGFGIVLVEAMIGKAPVISSDCDFGPREILENGKNGILVPVGDYKSMAKAILKLLENDELRKKFINNGLERAKFYSEERSFRLWNKLLTNI